MEILGLLEAAIGLVLIFLVLSLICSAWVEAIVNWTGLRGENLHQLIQVQCGGNEQLANLLLAQPQLRSLYAPAQPISWYNRLFRRALALSFDRGKSQTNGGFRPPSYIPPERFAQALSEMALGDSVARLQNTPGIIERSLTEAEILEQLKQCSEETQQDAKRGELSIESVHCKPREDVLRKAASHLNKVLTQLWNQAGGDADAFLKQIEKWFEDGNNRAAGWFKRKLAPKLFAVGLVIAFALNVDTLEILSRLSTDAELRQSLVTNAIEKVESVPEGARQAAESLKIEFDQAKQSLLELEPLLGWRDSSLPEGDESWWLWTPMKLIGLLITAIALSLGAPFWFDVLQKLVRVRASISQADTEKKATQATGEADASADRKTTGERTPARSSPSASDADDTPRLLAGMVGLAAGARAPDRRNARWMAELASLAYSGQEEVQQALHGLGLRLEHWIDSRANKPDAGIGDVDTQGFVAKNQDFSVVSFRGTEVSLGNPADVLTDIKAKLAETDWLPTGPDGTKPRAHRGFLLALDAIWTEMEEHLKTIATANPARPIWFAGHSLGGALAVLAAARYSRWREQENRERENWATELMEELEKAAGGTPDEHKRAETMRRIQNEAAPLPPCGWVYTIGQPAVGDQRVADWLDTHFGQRLVRTINNRDIVPRLPTPVLGYAHAGAELYFDSFGRMKLNPSSLYRGLDAMLVDPERAREQALEAVGDHKAETYIALLKGRQETTT
jgi:hypothetical protein